jgi:hypothetical protein
LLTICISQAPPLRLSYCYRALLFQAHLSASPTRMQEHVYRLLWPWPIAQWLIQRKYSILVC